MWLKKYLLNHNGIKYAYATTIHKAQGQSIDHVIVCEYNISGYCQFTDKLPIHKKYIMYATCMYTAITRARKTLVRLK
jgi:ATP-dependent exoDNAse (exonuclease V) alpha subunit